MNLTPEDATAEPATPVAPNADATLLLDQREASLGDERGIPSGLLRSGARIFPIFGPFG